MRESVDIPPSLSGGDQEISMEVGLSATATTLVGTLGTVATPEIDQFYNIRCHIFLSTLTGDSEVEIVNGHLTSLIL